MYLRGATHLIYAISMRSDDKDIDRIVKWIEATDQSIGEYATKANKFCILFSCDAKGTKEAKSFFDVADRYRMKYYKCSALTGEGIQQIREELICPVHEDTRFRDHIDVDFEDKHHARDQDVDFESKPTKSNKQNGICNIQ